MKMGGVDIVAACVLNNAFEFTFMQVSLVVRTGPIVTSGQVMSGHQPAHAIP